MNISQIKRTLVSPTFHIHRPSEECIENSVTFCGNQMKEIQQGSCCKHFIISYLPFSLIETSISPLWIFRFKTVYHIQHDIFLVLIWYNICHENLCDPYIISSKSWKIDYLEIKPCCLNGLEWFNLWIRGLQRI